MINWLFTLFFGCCAGSFVMWCIMRGRANAAYLKGIDAALLESKFQYKKGYNEGFEIAKAAYETPGKPIDWIAVAAVVARHIFRR